MTTENELIQTACPITIELAERACALSGWEDWNCLRTLAAAYAAVNEYAAAAGWMRKAIELAPPIARPRCQAELTRYNDLVGSLPGG